MVHSNYSVAGFALSLSLTTVAQIPVQAQVNFKLPNSVAQGTQVRVDGSSSMTAVNQVLKQRFEQKYPGTQVTLANRGTPQGLQALLDGKVDVAAIGRPLSAEERAKGLVAVPVGREKIAIVVSRSNPFNKGLNTAQFARIFRGEVNNWSQVGGPSVPIRLVDRPNSSDTRQALQNYPAFKQGKFQTGATAIQVAEDTTSAVIQKLGNNGISYSTANQIKNQPGVRAVLMHGTSPTNARYPFSQPLYYVYRADQAANPAVQSFLGFATAEAGQKAIAQAGVAAALTPVAAAPAKKAASQGATQRKDTAVTGASAAKGGQAGTAASADKAASYNANPQPEANQTDGDGDQNRGILSFLPSAGGGSATAEPSGGANWWWWLFPIASGAALLWLLGKGRRHRSTQLHTPTANGNAVPPARDYDSSPDSANFGAVDDTLPSGEFEAVNGSIDGANNNGAQGSHGAQGSDNFAGDPALGNADFAGETAGADGDWFNAPSAAIAGGTAVGAGAAAWAALRGRKQQTRIVLKARSPQEIEAFWDIPPEERDAVRQHGGEKLAIRLYDVTDIDLDRQPPHSVQQFECDELTHRQRLPIGLSDRDYLAELGYLTPDGQWLDLGRSTHVRVPPAPHLGSVESSRTVMEGDSFGGWQGDPAELGDVDRDPATDWLEETQPTPELQTEGEGFLERVGRRVSNSAAEVTQAGGAALAGGAAAATGAGTAAWSFLSRNRRDASTSNTPIADEIATPAEPNAGVDDRGQSNGVVAHRLEGRIVLTPRNAQWAYAYWDVPRTQRTMVERQPNQNLVLRLYDVTDLDAGAALPEQYEQFDVDDMALACDVPIPHTNRSYVVELGYVNSQDHWTRLARSTSVWMPAR